MTSYVNPERRILPEDGIVDDIAVWRATTGDLNVAVTWRELFAAIDILAERGMSHEDVAGILGISSRTVDRQRNPATRESRLLAQQQSAVEPKLSIADKKDYIRELKFDEGRSCSEISAAVGLSRGWVARVVAQLRREQEQSAA